MDVSMESEEKLSNRVQNELSRTEIKAHGANKIIGRDDRATTEQVMDPRTRMIVFKLLSTNFLTSVDGCVSTGKEANVYHAKDSSGKSVALKIFKTSILVFKDRDKYVNGEYRFKNSYGKKNPRKMVKMWALKELRNLRRLESKRISSPYAVFLRNNVLVLEFIGSDGWPAMRLKELLSPGPHTKNITEEHVNTLYTQCLKIMVKMYKKSKLVHGDLIEYNLLYVSKPSTEWIEKFGVYNLVVIDVSQSVEFDHPRTNEFLRMDIRNCNAFFEKLGASEILNDNWVYKIVKDNSLSLNKFTNELIYDINEEELLIDDWIRQALEEQKINPDIDFKDGTERNFDRDENSETQSNEASDLSSEFVTSEDSEVEIFDDEKSYVLFSEDEDSEEEESEGNELVLNLDGLRVGTVKLKELTKEQRKEHKKKVKEEARERRKLKTPKSVKKRNKKLAAQKKEKCSR